MKKSFLALLFAVVSLSASAQFERYTSYLNTSLTGLDLSYSKDQKVTFGLQATGGYFFEDSWMVYGRLGYQHQYKGIDNVKIGAGAQYAIDESTRVFAGLYFSHDFINNINYISPNYYGNYYENGEDIGDRETKLNVLQNRIGIEVGVLF